MKFMALRAFRCVDQNVKALEKQIDPSHFHTGILFEIGVGKETVEKLDQHYERPVFDQLRFAGVLGKPDDPKDIAAVEKQKKWEEQVAAHIAKERAWRAIAEKAVERELKAAVAA
jgi:hypothetical protein